MRKFAVWKRNESDGKFYVLWYSEQDTSRQAYDEAFEYRGYGEFRITGSFSNDPECNNEVLFPRTLLRWIIRINHKSKIGLFRTFREEETLYVLSEYCPSMLEIMDVYVKGILKITNATWNNTRIETEEFVPEMYEFTDWNEYR